MDIKKNAIIGAKYIVLVAIMSATLVVGKFALSFIPNIEVVTLLLVTYTFCYGARVALPASLVFCTVDIILYPPSPDVVISYMIYWNLLVIVIALLRCCRIKNEIAYTIVVGFMTILFGVITSLVYSIMFNISFLPYYLVGLPFYAAQFFGNIVLMTIAFPVLRKVLPKVVQVP